MGIYRCVECEQITDDDHEPGEEFKDGLICPSCAEISNQEIQCPHCFNTFISAAIQEQPAEPQITEGEPAPSDSVMLNRATIIEKVRALGYKATTASEIAGALTDTGEQP